MVGKIVMKPLDLAQKLAKAGYAVFPCNQNKAPACRNGLKDATRDLDKIMSMFGDKPDLMVGLPTGEINSLFVVDLDVGNGKNGIAEFRKLALQEPAIWQHTPSGGRHVLFEWRPGLRNTAGKLAPGIDTRGEGGYIIAPGSRNGAGSYALASGEAAFLQHKLPRAPETLLQRLLNLKNSSPTSSGSYGQKALDEECMKVRGASHGQRNDQLNHSAFRLGQLVAGDELRHDETVSRWREAARDTGLDVYEVEKTLISGIDAGRKSPRSRGTQVGLSGMRPRACMDQDDLWEGHLDVAAARGERRAAPEWPGHLFGEWEQPLRDLAASTGSPPDYGAMTLLTIAGSLLAGSRSVGISEGWIEPAMIWSALVGMPSASKSAPLRELVNTLREVQKERTSGYKSEYEAWQASVDVSDAAAKAYQKALRKAAAAGEDPPERPDQASAPAEPHLLRLVVGDVTVEKLASILSRQSEQAVLVQRDELAGFLGSMGRYSGAGTADRSFYLEGFSGGSFSVERQNLVQPIFIDNLRLGVVGTIQPDRLAQMLLDPRMDDGFAVRFMPVWPEKIEKVRFDDAADRQPFVDAFQLFASLQPWEDPSNGKIRPLVCRLTNDAVDAFYGYVGYASSLSDRSEGLLASLAGKLDGMAARVSLILAYLDHALGAADPFEINTSHIRRGGEFVHSYIWPMAQRTYQDSGVADQVRSSRKMFHRIEQKGMRIFSVREIIQMRLKGLETSREVKAALDHLADLGVVRILIQNSAAGKRVERYQVHPDVN